MSDVVCEILEKNVYYFPGIINDIDNVMATLEEVNSLSVTPWEVWYANNDAKQNPYGDLKTLSYSKLEEETDPELKAKSEYILSSILGAMEVACRKFMVDHGAPEHELAHMTREILTGGHTYGIRRYNENMDMGPHQDMVVDTRDTYTVAVYLDDDYGGGELLIVNNGLNISIKNKAGSIVVFPSSYYHASNMLTRGRKTIITHVHMTIDKLLGVN